MRVQRFFKSPESSHSGCHPLNKPCYPNSIRSQRVYQCNAIHDIKFKVKVLGSTELS